MFIASQAKTGWVSTRNTRCNQGCGRRGPGRRAAADAAAPRSRGTAGAPSSSSGGATDISIRCCVIWAISSRSSSVSRGEAIAIHRERRPPRKHHARQGGKMCGRVRRILRKPRR